MNNLVFRDTLNKIDSNRFVISISDSTNITIDSSFIIDKLKNASYRFAQGAITEYLHKTKREGLVNIDSIRKIGKFELIRFSELQKLTNNAEPYYPFYYFGNLTISRFFFDKELRNGFFIIEITCGMECHSRYLVLISKRIRWEITKFVLLSIS
jgi:hypothetical protein